MSDLKILTQDDVAEWFNSHHHDTVTAVREIDIIRAATAITSIMIFRRLLRRMWAVCAMREAASITHAVSVEI